MFSTITSGILSLDFVLGGGWPKGRVSEIYGLRGSGRSTIALHAVAAAQKTGSAMLLHNSNADADRRYALRLGADVWPTRFDSRSLVNTLCNVFDTPPQNMPDLLVVELETEKAGWSSELNQGLARFLRKFCEKPPRNTTILFVASGDITPLAYFGSARVQLRAEGDAACGDSVITAELVTHRLMKPGGMATLQITPGDGVDLVKDLVRAATFAGQVENIDADELCATLALRRRRRDRRCRRLHLRAVYGGTVARRVDRSHSNIGDRDDYAVRPAKRARTTVPDARSALESLRSGNEAT